jgi:hypothetical protein
MFPQLIKEDKDILIILVRYIVDIISKYQKEETPEVKESLITKKFKKFK